MTIETRRATAIIQRTGHEIPVSEMHGKALVYMQAFKRIERCDERWYLERTRH